MKKRFSFGFGIFMIVAIFSASNIAFASTIFTDSFGSSNTTDVPNWTDGGGDSSGDTYVTDSSGRAGSPTTRHARLRDGGYITKTVSTSGFTGVILKYYWRGDNDGDGNSDNLKVYWKKTSDSTFLLLNTHQLDGNDSWSSQVSVSLPATAENTSIDLKFLGDSNSDSEEARIDDVSLEGTTDTTAPVISQVTAVPSPTNDTTPNYTFTTNEAGTITYGGSCSSITTSAVVGSNTISFNALAEGTYSNCTIKVTDTALNQSNTLSVNTFTVDLTPPVITLSGSTPVTVEGGSTYTDAGATATESATVTTSGSVNTNAVGAYVLTYNATDSAGNSATPVTRTVNVVDTTAPTITLIGSADLTIEAGSTYTDAGSNVIDNIDMSLTATVTGSVNTGALGDYVLTFNVSDTAGNPATPVTRTVHVVDTTAPVITVSGGDMSLHTGDIFTDPGATATDNLDVSVTVVVTGTVNTALPGTYTIHYNAVDTAGNHATEKTRTVTVVDVSVPIITLNGDGTVTVEVGSDYNDAEATATDDVDGDLTGSILTVSTVNTAVVGSYTVKYNVSDSSMNPAVEITRIVNVVDTTNPVITVTGYNPTNIKVGDTYTEQGATATDNYDGDLTSSIVTTGSVNTAVAGTYTITYSVSDASGNDATATRDVIVRNLGTDASLFELSASAGILTPDFASTTYSYTVILPFGTTVNPTVYATTTDQFATKEIIQVSNIISANEADRTATVNVTSEQTGEGKVQKIYTVIFSVASNPDTTAPVINLNGDSTIEVIVGGTYTEQGATVTDNIDAELAVEITGKVDTDTEGSYIVYYNAVDTAGNHATEKTRTVNVVSQSTNTSEATPLNGTRRRREVRPSQGRVLGASVGPDGEEIGGSCEYVKTFLKFGGNNNFEDIVRLQVFLRDVEKADITITGVYDVPTINAVNAFQLKYKDKILRPWVLLGLWGDENTPTGSVYKTTKWWINAIKCNTTETATTPIIP